MSLCGPGIRLRGEPADSSLVQDIISIIDERAVDPHLARATLDRLSGRAREGLIGAGCALFAGAVLAIVGQFGIAAPAGLGAIAGLFVWLHARSDRGALVLRLVGQRSCYEIPEVERAAARMATHDLRRALSRSLTRLVLETHGLEPHNPLRPVIGVRVHPAALALCGRMIDSVTRSPLYNPRVPEQHLRIALQRVRASIS